MDWFHTLLETVMVLFCVGGIAFYAWRCWQERALNRYYAGLINMLAGVLVLILPRRVYGIEDDFTFWIGAFLFLSGLAQAAWFKGKQGETKGNLERQ